MSLQKQKPIPKSIASTKPKKVIEEEKILPKSKHLNSKNLIEHTKIEVFLDKFH